MAGERILIIDDEENIRLTMQLALEATGYQVATAADGPAGLQRFGAGTEWDLVLLDQRMPGMEGLEVLRHLRERDPSTRVVMATAYGTIELAVDAMKAGALDFLRKPFTPEALRAAVGAALEQPREAVAPVDTSLARLLPQAPVTPGPHVLFRTLNGYRFWSLPLPAGGEETEALRVRRAFEVRSPAGEVRQVAVEVATSVRESVRLQTGRDVEAIDPIWDSVCKMSLGNFVWQEAAMPPAVLTVYHLTQEQMRVVRRLAGRGPHPVH